MTLKIYLRDNFMTLTPHELATEAKPQLSLALLLYGQFIVIKLGIKPLSSSSLLQAISDHQTVSSFRVHVLEANTITG